MEKAIIEKFCKFALFSIFVLLDVAFALSVDYGKHHCNHEHPKHHEVSGVSSAKPEIGSQFEWNIVQRLSKKGQ
jgi:hypothetical protein